MGARAKARARARARAGRGQGLGLGKGLSMVSFPNRSPCKGLAMDAVPITNNIAYHPLHSVREPGSKVHEEPRPSGNEICPVCLQCSNRCAVCVLV